MSVKRILYIAPHSFPVHSSESIVNSKLAYTLCEAGYELDIYASQDTGIDYPSSSEESILISCKNMNLQTIPIDYLKKKSDIVKNPKLLVGYILGFIKTGHAYIGSDWNYKAISKIEENIRKSGTYDVMITRGFYTEIAGIYLNKKYGIKWIANWNDPYPSAKFPEPYGNGYDARLPFYLERVLADIQKHAWIHTFPCERLRDYMLLYYKKVNTDQTRVIPHMAHSALLPQTAGQKKRNKIRMIHAGDVSWPRNPNNFLCALSEVVSDESFRNKIECVFIGKQSDDFNDKLIELNLTDYVTVLPSMGYFDILKEMKQCDVSLIIEAICEEGIYLPTKVVDSVQCQLPLFCVSPSVGTLNDLIKETRIGYFSNNRSLDEIETNLKKMMVDWERDQLPVIEIDALSKFFEKNILLSYESMFKELQS